MMWHIAKRELYNNLNSLRFALTTLLLLAVMLCNAVVHLHEHPKHVQTYRTAVADAAKVLTARAEDSLYELAEKGPGVLQKQPSSLRFCAEGGEPFLPDVVEGGGHFWATPTLRTSWWLVYPSATPNLQNIRPDVTTVDWAFVIGYVLSLIALLFSFDAISGERERGTLRLMLANPIPRHTVLSGKFLGALLSISIPLLLSVLVNLLVILTARSVHLGGAAWGRLAIIFLIAVLYTCLFLALGLLVSARVRQSAVSLVILLVCWVSLVVFMPNTLASIASFFSPSITSHQLQQRREKLHDELWEKYRRDSTEPSKKLQVGYEYVNNQAKQNEQLNQEHLNRQISQIRHARAITRISPVTLVQHLLEAFSGTGFSRHVQFLENVRHYAREFRQFVIDTDRADAQSLHLVGMREGMSQKPISPEAVPIFEDTLSLTRDFNTAAMDLLLLVLFFVVLLAGAYLAFVRVEV